MNPFKKIIGIVLWPFKFILVNLYMLYSFALSLLPHEEVKKGDRFKAIKDLKVGATANYDEHFCDQQGFKCRIPQGTVLIARADERKVSRGFDCIPENEKEFEKRNVPKEIRNGKKYVGVTFSVKYSDLGKKFQRI